MTASPYMLLPGCDAGISAWAGAELLLAGAAAVYEPCATSSACCSMGMCSGVLAGLAEVLGASAFCSGGCCSCWGCWGG